MSVEPTCVPNHHAHYPAFAGFGGLIAAASMVVGRKGDAGVVAQLSNLRAGDTVFDIGCGPGTAARHAARLGATVTGIDPASVMLRVARLLTRSPAVSYLEGAAEALPLPDASASVVWTIASVHHWTDASAGLREARRVLVPGGRLVAIERLSQPGARGLASHGWTEQQARAFGQLCVASGFTGFNVDQQTTGRRTTISVTAKG